MNIPYVKQYDETGDHINPIVGDYMSYHENRRTRRSIPKRFRGNNKGVSLTVTPTGKYRRVRQIIECRDGKFKSIEHYV